MDDTSSQLTVPEAIDTVEQHQHDESDPDAILALAERAHIIRQRIQAKPLTYVPTKEEYDVLYHDFLMERFLDLFRPKPLDDQRHKARKEIRDSVEARDEEVSLERGIDCERYTELIQDDIVWVRRARKQEESTPETRKVDPGHIGSLEAVGVKTPHEKSKVFFETHSAQDQSTISEGSQPTQSEPIPQTPQVHRRLPEFPENLSIDRTRLLMHVSDGEEYGLVNSIKIWVQSLTRASWDWWPLHPSFRQLREDEVRIKWYCVSHYPRCLYPGLLNILKGIRARTLDCAPQKRAH